jgi:hypothetical protein
MSDGRLTIGKVAGGGRSANQGCRFGGNALVDGSRPLTLRALKQLSRQSVKTNHMKIENSRKNSLASDMRAMR